MLLNTAGKKKTRRRRVREHHAFHWDKKNSWILCVFVWDPGILGWQPLAVSMTLRAVEVFASRHKWTVCVGVNEHPQTVHYSYRLLCKLWDYKSIFVNLICRSLTEHTFLISSSWTITASALTADPAALCARYWGMCDRSKLGSAGPNWQFDGQTIQTEKKLHQFGMCKNSVISLPVIPLAVCAQPVKSLQAHLRCTGN